MERERSDKGQDGQRDQTGRIDRPRPGHDRWGGQDMHLWADAIEGDKAWPPIPAAFGPETALACIDEVQAALKGGPLLFLDFAGCKEDTLASSVWVIVSGHLLFNSAP